jgi:hypothetical protein
MANRASADAIGCGVRHAAVGSVLLWRPLDNVTLGWCEGIIKSPSCHFPVAGLRKSLQSSYSPVPGIKPVRLHALPPLHLAESLREAG